MSPHKFYCRHTKIKIATHENFLQRKFFFYCNKSTKQCVGTIALTVQQIIKQYNTRTRIVQIIVQLLIIWPVLLFANLACVLSKRVTSWYLEALENDQSINQ